MNIEHISVSRYGVWKECELRYKFHYHEKIVPEGESPFYFTYGKIVRKIAEEYVEKKGARTLNEVAKDVLQGKISIERGEQGDIFAPPLPEDYKARLPGHLRALQSLTDQIGMDGELEWPFYYDLDPPHGKHVKGFIDRLIQRGDKWFIIDYKTTKRGPWRKTAHNISHDLQLRTYGRIVQKTFNVPSENIRAALYYLEGGNLIATQRFTDNHLESAEKELLEAYKRIESTPPETAQGLLGDWCRRCDYRKMCPLYRLT